MNGNYYDFKKLIFPHLQPHHKQKKEINFIYCYNFRFNGELSPQVDKDFKKYLEEVRNFIKRTNKRLVGHEMDNLRTTRIIKYEMFDRDRGENSAFFELKPVPPQEIEELNSFLITTGYRKKYDRFGYFYEGCLNDDKVFIGGKSQLIAHFCKNFGDIPVCRQIKESLTKNYIDSRLGLNSDEAVVDNSLDTFTKLFDK